MKDFVLVILKAPDISKQEYVAYLNDIMESVSLDNDFEFSPINENKITMNKFMIYEGFIRQSYETYLDILNTNKPLKDEILESLQYTDDRPDSKLEILENSVMNLSPYPYTNYFEEGNPAKFQKITEQENWVILKILRYGSLENNHLLQDETIIKELKGQQGNNNIVYKNSMPSKNKAKIREIKTGLSECLYYNKKWSIHFDMIFDYYNKKDDILNYSLDVAVFTPNNILLSLYYELTREKKGYIPFYKLQYKFSEPKKYEKNYLGMFIWNGKKPNFKRICKKYYQGDSFQLVLPMIWGGHESRNNEILEDLGLIYSTWLEVIKEGEETQYFILEDYKFKKIIPKKHNYLFINNFIANNNEFIESLVTVINNHSHGDNNEIISS